MSDSPVTVILLEDDAAFSDLLADGLRHAGYAVVEAPTAARAAAALETVQGRGVLVADRAVEPQGPNGFQFASEALERHPQLGVVYISGTHIAVRRRALGERERALLKPFAMAQLLTAVRELAG